LARKRVVSRADSQSSSFHLHAIARLNVPYGSLECSVFVPIDTFGVFLLFTDGAVGPCQLRGIIIQKFSIQVVFVGAIIDEHTGRIVMELATGGSLEEFVAATPLNTLDALYWRLAEQVAQSLLFLHTFADGPTRGIVHRDLKPDNVLLDHAGNARLADLGHARTQSVHAVASSKPRGGAAQYSAMELVLHDREAPFSPTVKMDVWSFGGLLYFMCTGNHPFHDLAVSQNGLKMQQHKDNPANLLGLLHKQEADVQQLIRSCWCAQEKRATMHVVLDICRGAHDVRRAR
jgi:hypothetical protein